MKFHKISIIMRIEVRILYKKDTLKPWVATKEHRIQYRTIVRYRKTGNMWQSINSVNTEVIGYAIYKDCNNTFKQKDITITKTSKVISKILDKCLKHECWCCFLVLHVLTGTCDLERLQGPDDGQADYK